MTGKRSRNQGGSEDVMTQSCPSRAAKRIKLSTRPLTPPPEEEESTDAPAIPAAGSNTTTTPGHAEEPHPQSQSRLLRLPWELRSQIYRLALAKPALDASLLDFAHDNSLDLKPPLLRTCRRLRAEALPLFYASNDWVVKTRRVNNRLDPETRRPVLYEILPRWVESLALSEIEMVDALVVVGTRGSYVDVEGSWREGGRAAFRIARVGKRPGYVVEEVAIEVEDRDHSSEEDEDLRTVPKSFCGVRLVDLLRARMRCFVGIDGGGGGGKGKWCWNRQGIHEIACLL